MTIDRNRGRDYVELLRKALPDLETGQHGRVSSKRVPTLTHLVCLSREGRRHEGFLDFEAWAAGGRDYDASALEARIKEGRWSDIRYMCQTSGSTGLSKSALWNHRTPLASAHFLARHLNLTEEDTYINLTPFFHNSGMCALNLNLVYAGTTLYLMKNFDPQRAVEMTDRYEITTTGGFDVHWQAMRRVLAAGGRRFTIRKVVGAISSKTYRMIEEEMCTGPDVNILMLYAQTEGIFLALTEPDCMVPELRRGANGRPPAGETRRDGARPYFLFPPQRFALR